MNEHIALGPAELTEQARQLGETAAHLHTRAIRRRESALAAREQALSITGQAESTDGAVRATVDVAGMLIALDIAPDGLARGSDHLALLVTSVTQQAAASARAQVRSLYQPLIEEGVVREVPFALPESDHVTAPVARPTRRGAVEDEASFEETSLLRRSERW